MIKPCRVDGCSKLTGMSGTGHGLCKAHYLRWYKYGRLDLIKAPAGAGTISGGYRMITVGGKQIREHRHVIQQMLGRPLAPEEVVHHIDGNKLNNDLDNLQVLSPADHNKTRATFRNETHKECVRCHVVKPRWQFRIDKSSPARRRDSWDTHTTECRECVRLREHNYDVARWARTKALKQTPDH